MLAQKCALVAALGLGLAGAATSPSVATMPDHPVPLAQRDGGGAALNAVTAARNAALKTAFVAWAKHYGVKNTALAILDHGTISDSVALGDDTPQKPEPIASESKSITGICILKLVEAGKLKFSDTLGERLPAFLAANPPRDPAARKITISQLLTHSSGIAYDPTQGSALAAFKPYTRLSLAKELAAALSHPLGQQRYAYNNVNYAALGLVIQEVTGESYEDHCRNAVLVPVGVTDAKLNPAWMVMGSFGGWVLSAHDEAKFLSYFDPASGLLKTPAKRWPKADAGGGASYSLGVLMRPAGGGFNFWHFGSWSVTDPTASFGAYFARWSNGVGVSATYQPALSDAAAAALDNAMAEAAGG